MNEKDKEMISTAEAKDMLGLSHAMVHKLIKSGKLTPIYDNDPGRQRRKISLDKAEVERYISQVQKSRKTP